MRKLASIRRIDIIKPIPGADAIECAILGGWPVVTKKGEYKVGDLAVYVEIDSWVPTELAPFLSKGKEPSVYNDIRGERLRSVRLRGQLSQGLLLPMGILENYARGDDGDGNMTWYDPHDFYQEGEDVSEVLGIQKWEAPIPACLAGDARGLFPSFIPKTDQERVQNLTAEIEDYRQRELSFEASEKLDGSSMTVYVFDEDEGVCSRNLNLKESESNSLWRVARRDQLIEKIRSTGRNLALQGELIGEGIQGNPYKIKGQQFYVFDIYKINSHDRGTYLPPAARRDLCELLKINHVPVYGKSWQIVDTVPEMLTKAEAKSMLNSNTEQEGVVYKCNQDPDISFKVISNKFLIKTGN
jgi:RNA ligase (TIGR02306 family)